jgi:hypothetical protein
MIILSVFIDLLETNRPDEQIRIIQGFHRTPFDQFHDHVFDPIMDLRRETRTVDIHGRVVRDHNDLLYVQNV